MNIQDLLHNPKVLAIYKFGSHVYLTNNENSDEDYIVIAEEYFDSQNINIHVYTKEQFQLKLDNHDIQVLECYFLGLANTNILKVDGNLSFDFNLDLHKLRTSISTIASNSFVKGKKKLTISGDYDLNLAIKSIFHSLRILDFGIQIASEGKISNYSSMNWLLEDLWKLSEQFQRDELWNAIDIKYRKLYNSKSSEFKALAPKNLTEQDKEKQLYKIFDKFGLISNEHAINEILELFK